MTRTSLHPLYSLFFLLKSMKIGLCNSLGQRPMPFYFWTNNISHDRTTFMHDHPNIFFFYLYHAPQSLKKCLPIIQIHAQLWIFLISDHSWHSKSIVYFNRVYKCALTICMVERPLIFSKIQHFIHEMIIMPSLHMYRRALLTCATTQHA